MNKRQLLEHEAQKIRKCKICKIEKTGKPVPGEGNPNAKIFFVGEAPGATEAKTGRPFVGRSGQLLTKLLEDIGIKREDIYITSPVKYFPVKIGGGGRTPTDLEIAHGKTHLLAQIEIINPKIIVLLGAVAARSLIGTLKISQDHGNKIIKDNRIYFPTFHPAAALRFPRIKEEMIKDLAKLKKLL